MNDERSEARAKLLEIIEGYRQRGEPIILEELRAEEEVNALLLMARPEAECIDFALHRLLQSLVKSIRLPNRYHSPAFGALPASLFQTKQVEGLTPMRFTHLYATAEAIEANPAFTNAAKLGALRLLTGIVEGMGYFGDDKIELLVEGIGEVFDRVLTG